MAIKYDNCKDCHSRCIHAGKDRDFICMNGVSCKITTEKPHTNADRIRSMTDEELADFLAYTWATSARAWQKDKGETMYWLQQPAEGE